MVVSNAERAPTGAEFQRGRFPMHLVRLALAWLALGFSNTAIAAAPVYDGQGNSYRISIDANARRAQVRADLWLAGGMLSMFNVMTVPGLADGQADLVEGLQVRDAAGTVLAPRKLGGGDYELAGGRRILVQYSVRLDHDKYAWPAGAEEIGYWTDEGLMITGASLLFADGGDAGITGPITVEFELPRGWRANTPWQRAPGAEKSATERFSVPSRRELLSNALFLGTADSETFDVGGVQMTLVLGNRYVPSKDLFLDLLRTQLESYKDLFGGKPLSSRYLVIINEDKSGDGGAFASSFSQYIAGDADERNRVIWGYVMAHELLHFWNGLSITPVDYHEEWFKEGATDYLTIATLARNGFIDENLLFKRLENVPRRYLIARMAQGLGMSVRDSGKDKQPNRQLVYGGGSLAAMALDVEMRVRSRDRVGLPDLMKALYAQYPMPGKRYSLDDIARIAGELTQSDFRPFLANAVESTGYFDIRPTYEALGLRMDSFVDEMFIGREPGATAQQKARFDAIFGAVSARSQ